ncbi:MAG: hypothetical protein RIA63_01680, partial [Cyclobacteriaceae bacterium]
MKNPKILFTAAFLLCATITSFGRETDDMYFNSKDRAELNAKKITADLGLTKRSDVKDANSPINPTDSYSARNINPEYASRLNSGSEVQVENDYFLPDFQPTGINQNLSNCNCSGGSYYNPNSFYGGSAFNNPYYGNMGGFGSPYGGFYPSSWGYPSYGYNSGLSMSMGYGLGGFNPGFYGGLGYGYGSYS